MPAFRTVGPPDASVREARERVRAALRTNGFEYPAGRITLSLVPAEVPKQGAGFDLAVAIGLLAARDPVPTDRLSSTLLMGELALDGTLRPVRGVFPVAVEARSEGVRMAEVTKVHSVARRLPPSVRL